MGQSYFRLGGKLFHRECIVGIVRGKTWLRKRPYIEIADIGTTSFPMYLMGWFPLWHFNRARIADTRRIYFTDEVERDMVTGAQFAVCPNVVDTSFEELAVLARKDE